jgi:hypothetical protein
MPLTFLNLTQSHCFSKSLTKLPPSSSNSVLSISEHRHETSSQRILRDPQIDFLLRSRTPGQTQHNTTWSAENRRSVSPKGIPGTPLTGKDAETIESEDCRARQEMRHLPRRVHKLQRHRARPRGSQRHVRGVERRPSRQYPRNTLVVQRRKGIHQNGWLTADQSCSVQSTDNSTRPWPTMCQGCAESRAKVGVQCQET